MKQQKGFTLIELIVVVAIIAILASIAYPTYQDSVQKSRRADARAVVLEAAQFMERFYTENFCYSKRKTATGCDGTDVALPAALQTAPKDGSIKYYNITLNNLAATTYTLQAAPIGAQAGDACGTLTLTNAGVKGVSGGSKSADECWR